MSRADHSSSEKNEHKSRPAGRRLLNNAPIINPQSFTVKEGVTVGTNVGSVQASDPDVGQSLSYSITAGNEEGRFAINANTGSLTVAGSLDHEVIGAYDLTVRVADNSSGTPLFESAVNYNAGLGTISVAVADLNGDGYPDFAAANYNGKEYSVRLNNGAGGFGSLSNVSFTYNPTFIVVRDMNNDGKPDLVITTEYTVSPDNVGIFLGDGAGNFGPVSYFAVGERPQSVTIEDFNGDGNLDVAVANVGSNNISVLLGDGLGSLGTATHFGIGMAGPDAIVAGDFNGDGHWDLAVANKDSNSVSVLLGDGTGNFNAGSIFSVGLSPSSVALGDFNADGKLDIVAANRGDSSVPGSYTVSMALGKGDGSFEAAIDFTVGAGAHSVAVADVNGDGHLDIATANNGSDDISVLLGDGTGSFSSAESFGVANNPRSVIFGDINQDGNPDAVIASFNSNTVGVLISNQPSSAKADIHIDVFDVNEAPVINPQNFRVNENAAPGTVVGAVQASDPDVGQSLTYNFNTENPGPFTMDPNTGVLTLTDPIDETKTGYNFSVDVVDDPPATALFEPAVSYVTGDAPGDIVIGDINEDGHLDLAIASINSHNVAVLLGDGAGHFNAPTNFAVGGALPISLAMEDLNADGHLDLATANIHSDDVSVMLGNGFGGFGTATTFSADAPESVAIGDLNEDGNLDLVATNPSSNTVSVLLGDGTGNFGSANLFGVSNPYSVAIADLNNDGHLDLAVTNRNTNRFSFLLGDGAGDFVSPHDFGTGLDPKSLAVGDVNGDGNQDIVIANYVADDISVFLGDGTGGFTLFSDYPVGSSPETVDLRDLNMDGFLDVAIANENSNSISVLLGDGTGSFIVNNNFPTGNGARSVVAGDFNEDGYPDLAVADRNANTASVLISNSPITTQASMHVAVNHRPVVAVNSISDQTVPEGPFVFPYPSVFSDPDGDSLVQTIIPGTNAGTVESNGTYIFGTATNANTPMDMELMATDTGSLSAVKPFRISVGNAVPESTQASSNSDDMSPLLITMLTLGSAAILMLLAGLAFLLYRKHQTPDPVRGEDEAAIGGGLNPLNLDENGTVVDVELDSLNLDENSSSGDEQSYPPPPPTPTVSSICSGVAYLPPPPLMPNPVAGESQNEVGIDNRLPGSSAQESFRTAKEVDAYVETLEYPVSSVGPPRTSEEVDETIRMLNSNFGDDVRSTLSSAFPPTLFGGRSSNCPTVLDINSADSDEQSESESLKTASCSSGGSVSSSHSLFSS